VSLTFLGGPDDFDPRRLDETCPLRAFSFGSSAFMAGIAASAQGIITGGVHGTVTDQTGAVIPGAAVSVTNTATGAIVQAKSTGPPFDLQLEAASAVVPTRRAWATAMSNSQARLRSELCTVI
jgi:hypothetical protein